MRPESLKYFFDRMGLQLRADELRYHHVRARVRTHRYTDATLAVFHGPGKLARYDTTGQLVSTRQEVLKAAAWRQPMTARVLRGRFGLRPSRPCSTRKTHSRKSGRFYLLPTRYFGITSDRLRGLAYCGLNAICRTTGAQRSRSWRMNVASWSGVIGRG